MTPLPTRRAGIILCSLLASTLLFAKDSASGVDAGKGKLPPPPTPDQIDAFKTSHVNPKTGVRLTYEMKVLQPEFKKPPKQGNYLGIQTAWYNTYLSGKIPFRVTGSFKYEETNLKNPAGERKKFGAYYTPPADTYVLIRDEEKKIVSYFHKTAAEMCLH